MGPWKPNIRQRAVSENPGHVFAMLITSPPHCRQTFLQAEYSLGPGVRSMLGLGVGRGIAYEITFGNLSHIFNALMELAF